MEPIQWPPATSRRTAWMAFAVLGLAVICAALWPHRVEAQRGGPAKIGPIPFEVDLARERRDRVLLNFNDHVSIVPATRVRGLPMIGGRLGDRVVTSDGLLLFFPVGYLVTAAYEFDKHRLRAGRAAAASSADLEANPHYAWVVARFDSELGPVCARSTDRSANTVTELRQRGRILALVVSRPGRHDKLANETSRSFAVLAGVEERYVAADDLAKKLLAQCRAGATGTAEVPGEGLAVRILTASDAGL